MLNWINSCLLYFSITTFCILMPSKYLVDFSFCMDISRTVVKDAVCCEMIAGDTRSYNLSMNRALNKTLIKQGSLLMLKRMPFLLPYYLDNSAVKGTGCL